MLNNIVKAVGSEHSPGISNEVCLIVNYFVSLTDCFFQFGSELCNKCEFFFFTLKA